MGLGRRLLETARDNLNTLLERAARGELEARTEDELKAELQRRKSERNAQEMERQRRIAIEAAAKARGERRVKTEARGPGRQAAEAASRAFRLRALYAELGVPNGATHLEVKRAYRRLMRQHHPDRNTGDSDRAAQIAAAYAELEALLGS